MCFSSMSSASGGTNTAAAITGLGTLTQYEAQSRSTQYAANAARTNATLAREQLYQVGEQGSQQANLTRAKGRATMSSQSAAYGASGVSSTTGSAVNTAASTAYAAEADAQKIQYNTMLKQWGLQNEAIQYENQAKQIEQAGRYSTMSTLLTGASNIAKIYATSSSLT